MRCLWILLVVAYATAETIVPGAKYLGCYKDTGNRALRGYYRRSVFMTNAYCVQTCKEMGFRYAGIQFGMDCTCGLKENSYKTHGEATNCDAPCRGKQATEICGGTWAMQVYEISTPAVERVGCFLDNGHRAMNKVWAYSAMMSIARCITLCGSQGMPYAGLQAGGHCFCDEDGYDKLGELDETRCNTVCTGSRRHVCGGGWANAVYKTGKTDAAAVSATPLGCWRDTGTRALNAFWVLAYQQIQAMTPEYCQKMCYANGNTYAAVQAGAYCFCGNDYDRYGPIHTCTTKCQKDPTKTCGGSAANQVYQVRGSVPEPLKATPKGCWLDKGARALNGYNTVDHSMTYEKCVSFCGEMGFKYAAIQARVHCFCGNEGFDKYGKYDKCIYPCPGNGEQKCGGPWANQVFEIESPKHDMVGCYLDKGERALGDTYFTSADMSIELCVTSCKELGYVYAGLQAGSYCFCGNEGYDQYGEQPYTCRSTCSGNHKTGCGGGWRNMVYRTGLDAPVADNAIPYVSKGCYQDTALRALPRAFINSPEMSNQMCLKICKGKGTKYAATQAGQYCFCGDEPYDVYSENMPRYCNVDCVGDKSQLCGGGGRNQVYQIGGLAKDVQTCAISRKRFAENNLPVTPKMTDDCRFETKQCNSKKCWCFDPVTGAVTSNGAIGDDEECGGYKYIGCFKDAGDRALDGSFSANYMMSVGMCARRCQQQGYRYFGLQAASYCFCGNDNYDKHGEAVRPCSMKCAGLKSENCGHAWTNSVYSIESTTVDLVGCYQDKADRAMRGYTFTSAYMTNELCIKTCKGRGFEYAATEAGRECYCDNEYDRYGEFRARCRTACTGRINHSCGGSWALQVYRTGTKGDESQGKYGAVDLGCWYDRGPRALNFAWIQSRTMTNKECQQFCRIQGTKYSATQAGGHCFCGNEFYDKYGPNNAGCRSPCAGNKEEFCGGGGVNKVSQIAGEREEKYDATEKGCFKDTGTRALFGSYTNNGQLNNNQLCVKRCAEQGFKYAATQAGTWCFCGNEDNYDRYGKATCDTPCRNTAEENCGGSWANRVWEIKAPKYNRLGCWLDKNVRALDGPYWHSTHNNIENCVDACANMGFKYAGLQAGAYCFCGNSYDKYEKLAPNRCHTPCAGNVKHSCGGAWANAVFATGANGTPGKSIASINMGCELDSADRAMDGMWFTANPKMTTKFCFAACAARGTRYAAIQQGLYCFCIHNRLKRGPSSACNSVCYGNEFEFCGGAGRRRVYLIGEHAMAKPLPPTDPVTTEKPTPTPKPTKPPKATKPEKTPKPTKPPKTTPEPTPAPTPAPTTEEIEKCEKQIAAFKENNLPIEPKFAEGCTFVAKQCDATQCWCVKPKTGERVWDTVVVPASEKFDCSSKPKKCFAKRFKLLLKGGKKKVFIPECSKTGKYAKMQCFEGECWCVKPRGGKEIKKSRTKGKANC